MIIICETIDEYLELPYRYKAGATDLIMPGTNGLFLFVREAGELQTRSPLLEGELLVEWLEERLGGKDRNN